MSDIDFPIYVVCFGLGFLLGLILMGVTIESDSDTIHIDTLNSLCEKEYGEGYVYYEEGIGQSYSINCIKEEQEIKTIITG